MLSRVGIERLTTYRQTDPVLAFDFDGTLAPLVDDPAAAQIPASTRALLTALALRHMCVIVSGRERADVLSRLHRIPISEVVGNHGSEPWIDTGALRHWIEKTLPRLRQQLAPVMKKGAWLEDKGVSVSVHYRQAFDRAETIAATHRAAKSLGFAPVIPGKFVINLLPPGALDKAQGLLRAMALWQKTSAIYVGDDTTDERVFELPSASGVLGIRVGYSRASRAQLYLKQQSDIDRLLALLLRD